MKRSTIFIVSALFSSFSIAGVEVSATQDSTMQDFDNKPAPSKDEIYASVKASAAAYANSISCDSAEIIDVVPLNPWVKFYDGEGIKYLVVWSGDIGCMGGNGTSTFNAAVVKRESGFYVDPLESSPAIKFDVPMSAREGGLKIIRLTDRSIAISGVTYGPNDPGCCPSLETTAVMASDGKGNWLVNSNAGK